MWGKGRRKWVKTLYTDLYMHKVLYIKLMVATNQKPVIDMQKNNPSISLKKANKLLEKTAREERNRELPKQP